MRPVKTILTLLLAIVWLPVSSHVLLERVGVIHESHADHHDADSTDSHEHGSDNHDAADGKCALSSAHVSIPVRTGAPIQMLLCVLDLNLASEINSCQQPSGLPPPGTAPPQLSHCWQFSFRTALPARAPSLIS